MTTLPTHRGAAYARNVDRRPAGREAGHRRGGPGAARRPVAESGPRLHPGAAVDRPVARRAVGVRQVRHRRADLGLAGGRDRRVRGGGRPVDAAPRGVRRRRPGLRAGTGAGGPARGAVARPVGGHHGRRRRGDPGGGARPHRAGRAAAAVRPPRRAARLAAGGPRPPAVPVHRAGRRAVAGAGAAGPGGGLRPGRPVRRRPAAPGPAQRQHLPPPRPGEAGGLDVGVPRQPRLRHLCLAAQPARGGRPPTGADRPGAAGVRGDAGRLLLLAGGTAAAAARLAAPRRPARPGGGGAAVGGPRTGPARPRGRPAEGVPR